MLTVNIIGAGALGQTLGHLLVQHQAATVLGVVTRHVDSAQSAIQFIGQGQYYASPVDLPMADITFITTPDQVISIMAQQLAQHALLRPGSIVLHCSGALSSDCLVPLRQQHIYTASVHPMASFKQPSLSVKQFAGIPCALEGDEAAVTVLKNLFLTIGADVFLIPKEKKVLYHIAAVFASNYQITLAQQAKDCFRAVGLEETQAQTIIQKTTQSVLHNIMYATEPKDVLTGPIQRGDMTTLQKHIEALTEYPQWLSLYLNLGQATVSCTSLDPKVKLAMFTLFSENLGF